MRKFIKKIFIYQNYINPFQPNVTRVLRTFWSSIICSWHEFLFSWSLRLPYSPLLQICKMIMFTISRMDGVSQLLKVTRSHEIQITTSAVKCNIYVTLGIFPKLARFIYCIWFSHKSAVLMHHICNIARQCKQIATISGYLNFFNLVALQPNVTYMLHAIL